MNWMTMEGNYMYNVYGGDVVMGKMREGICNDVGDSINNSGVLSTRTGPQVEGKIRKLESEFKHVLWHSSVKLARAWRGMMVESSTRMTRETTHSLSRT
jgi:hypothetical protein